MKQDMWRLAAACMISVVALAAQAAVKVVSPSPVYALAQAIQRANDGDIIFVKNGEYKWGASFKFEISKKNVTIIGESRDGVILTGSRYSPLNGTSNATYTLLVDGNNFYAENLTIQNTAVEDYPTASPSVGQALALRVRSDSVIFNNCRLLGYQDTHWVEGWGNQYYLNCETRGDVDFICGNATLMYEDSELISRSRRGAEVAVPSDNGKFVFRSCTLTAEEGSTSLSSLGRPWDVPNLAAFVNCKMGSHIKTEGWDDWGGRGASSTFGEYNSMNLDGTPMDTSQRVSWSKQFTKSEVEQLEIPVFFNGWNPREKIDASLLPSPSGVTLNGASLSWDSVEYALGYLIYRNDSMMFYTANTSYNVGAQVDARYTVRTVNQYGRFNSDIPTGIWSNKAKSGYNIYVANNILYVPENVGVEVYNLMGSKVLSSGSTLQTSLYVLPKGVYIVRVLLNKKGEYATQKIFVGR